MGSSVNKRDRTDNVAAEDHSKTPPSNDESTTPKQSQVCRTQGTLELPRHEKVFDVAQGNESEDSPSPEARSSNGSTPAGRTSRQGHPQYAPSNAATSSGPSDTKVTPWPGKPQPISIEPPVTKGTLDELDVIKIVNNPKLRHDVNFDPELHFRPNLDGEKGRRKTEKANYFWRTMKGQLQDFLTNQEKFKKELGASEWCLPATLNAIRDILGSLIPAKDQDSVAEMFNVDLLMQQFRMGVADLGKLALWLSSLLKSYCAPMRDNWIDEMVRKLSQGGRTGDVTMLIAGMKNLLGILEAMKLDIANHQIKRLRPLLLNAAVHFEQRFFMKKIALGRVDISGAHAWFRGTITLPETASGSTVIQSQTWDFMKALLQLIRPSKSDIVPHTFLFDEERLTKLREDMLDLVNLEISMQLYRNLEASTRSSRNGTPTSSFASSPFHRSALPADENLFSSPMIFSLHYFISYPSAKHLWVPKVSDSHTGSSAPSLRSSSSSTASTPNAAPLTPLYLAPVPSDSASQLRTSLLAILASSASSKKWEFLAPDLALQIMRQTMTSLAPLPQFEIELASHLSNPKSQVYKDAEEYVLEHFNSDLTKLVETYMSLSNLQIFEAATAPKAAAVTASVAVRDNTFNKEILEMATRLAHIGVLHWRVWAALAYLVDPDAVDTDAIEEEIPHSERAKSMH
ncbi:related to SOK1 protein [Rhynchosporium agropyri]|uniref:Related to SOK1 protein n=1 Tax=Rhynchosporium agropyri TaxID=914238 RepID=A0A1E1K3A5_9HELO|nr:related to SOK1 protein [Rhynchosporium agropyri]